MTLPKIIASEVAECLDPREQGWARCRSAAHGHLRGSRHLEPYAYDYRAASKTCKQLFEDFAVIIGKMELCDSLSNNDFDNLQRMNESLVTFC